MEHPISSKYQLEPQQYERLYYEEDIPLKDISRGLGPRLLGIGAVLFVAAVLVASFVTYPDQLELPFVLKGDTREQVYTFPFPVYVKEVFVRAGEQVQANQPLVRLTSPEVASMIAELEGRTAKKATFESFTGSSYARQLEMLDKQVLQHQARVSQLQSDLDLMDQQWNSRVEMLDVVMAEALDHLESARKLYQDGIISRFDLQEKEKIYAQARDNRSNGESVFKREKLTIQASLEETRQSIASAQLEKSKLNYDKAARSGDLDSDATAANELIQSIFGKCRIEDGSVILLSPAAQSVSFVFEGDVEIKPGVTVLKLNQSSNADYAFVKCPPSAAGKIKEGMRVNLKVSSFPYYEWGVAEGSIRSKSISPDENGAYNIRVSLDHLKRLEDKLFPGLDGSAVVVLEKKTLFQYFFRDLSKAYHITMDGQ